MPSDDVLAQGRQEREHVPSSPAGRRRRLRPSKRPAVRSALASLGAARARDTEAPEVVPAAGAMACWAYRALVLW